MLSLPPATLTLLVPFARLFRRRIWPSARVLVVGSLIAPGKRTVTAALRVMGLEQARRFAYYQRVLNRAQWSSRAVSCVLLGLWVATFAPTRPPSAASRGRAVGPTTADERNWTSSGPAALPTRGCAVAGRRTARGARRSPVGASPTAPGEALAQEPAPSPTGRAAAPEASRSCRGGIAQRAAWQTLGRALKRGG